MERGGRRREKERREEEEERREEERELPVSAEANPALQIRTDDITQDVVPVTLMVAHQEHVVLPWINLRANRWRTRWRRRWRHNQSLATSLAI